MRLFEGTPFDIPPRCDRCGELEADCQCPPPSAPPREWAAPETQTVNVRVEKRKKGKRVTVIRGLSAETTDLPELLTRLKNHCGAGGAVKDDDVEVQGDHQQRICDALRDLGYKVKG